MTRRSKVWLAVVALFTAANFAGTVIAAVQREPLHAGLHTALVLLGAYFVWQAIPGSGIRRGWRREAPPIPIPVTPPELTERLTHLEQAIDAMAIEVERIGEGQRFITRSFTQNGPPRVSGEGVAEPIKMEAREAMPQSRRR